ncbi:hypothetical protein HA402_008040 [Bradysia odoriphaga]|nr:hypothetical protein HA402_008040 [Bradysia odoriphaga]
MPSNDDDDIDNDRDEHTELLDEDGSFKILNYLQYLSYPLTIGWHYWLRESFESNVTVIEEIGPKFRRHQLSGLLKRDFKNLYQRKCTKISGDENAFAKLITGNAELKNCFHMWLHPENETKENVMKKTDLLSRVMKSCQKLDGLFDCADNFIALKKQCSFPSEFERVTQIRNVLKALLHSICSNGGIDVVSLVSPDGEGRKCIKTNINEVKTCNNKAEYIISNRILTRFIENEHFEFKMYKDDCIAFDSVMECFITSVENCADPIARDQITSIFKIFRDQTSCATFT